MARDEIVLDLEQLPCTHRERHPAPDRLARTLSSEVHHPPVRMRPPALRDQPLPEIVERPGRPGRDPVDPDVATTRCIDRVRAPGESEPVRRTRVALEGRRGRRALISRKREDLVIVQSEATSAVFAAMVIKVVANCPANQGQSQMQIHPGPDTLGSILALDALEVPTFQRGYSWTKKELWDYLRDVTEAARLGTSHFFGPLVLLREPPHPEVQIVDGQQRVTTSVMCLSILRDIVVEFDSPTIFGGTVREKNLHGLCFEALFREDGNPRFTAAPAIRFIFRERVLAEPAPLESPRQRPPLTVRGREMPDSADRRNSKELRAAWVFLNDQVRHFVATGSLKDPGRVHSATATLDEPQQKENILNLFAALTKNFSIYSMVLASEQDAYILFETLNDRGLRLSPGDILKTMTLRKISGSGSEDMLQDALQRWDRIGDFLDDYDISRFLRHFLLATSKNPVRRDQVLEKFRQRIDEAGPSPSSGAQQNLIDLHNAAEGYSSLIGVNGSADPHLDDSAQRLNVLGDTHRVFMLGVILMGAAVSTDDRRRLFRATEYLHFRWTLAGRNAQALENTYQNLLSGLQDSVSVDSTIQEVIRIAPNDDEFKDSHASAEVFNSNADHVRYVLHRIATLHSSDVPHWKSKSQLSLEHLAPQKPKQGANWFALVAPADAPSGTPNEPVYDDFKERWGNLTMLEYSLNASIKNAEWGTKLSGSDGKKGIRESTYSLNSPLKVVPVWNRKLIDHRTEWLRDSMLILLSKDWVKNGSCHVPSWDHNLATE